MSFPLSSQKDPFIKKSKVLKVFLGGSDGKELACNAVSVPGSGRSPVEGHGNPLQCSSLENPMDRGAWRAAGHGVSKSWTQLGD